MRLAPALTALGLLALHGAARAETPVHPDLRPPASSAPAPAPAPAPRAPLLRVDDGTARFAVPVLVAGTVEGVGAFPLDRYGTELPGTLALGPLVRLGLLWDSGREWAPFGVLAEVEHDLVTGWSASPEGPPALALPPGRRDFYMGLRKAHARLSLGTYLHLGGGFMVNHWGLGLVGNDGAHGWEPGSARFTDPRGGDRVLRGYLATGPLTDLGLLVLAGVDQVQADDVLLPGDEAMQGVASVLLGYGKPTSGGVFAARRLQETPDGRELEVTLLDATATTRLALSDALDLTLAGEVAWASGRATLVPTVDHPEQDVSQLGAVLRAGVAAESAGGVLDLLYASGDQNLDDDTQHGFRADPNFEAGLLLFRWVTAAQSARTPVNAGDPTLVGFPSIGLERIPSRGSMTNTIAFFPRGWWRPVEGLELYAGPLLAWAATTPTEPFNTRLAGGVSRNALDGEPGSFLGAELDLGVRERLDLGGVQLTVGAEGAALFPGSAFADPAGEPPGPLFGGRLMLETRL